MLAYADSPGADGWRTLKQKRTAQIYTSNVIPSKAAYYTLALCDLPGILAYDWRYAWFRVFGCMWVFLDGFGQGSPCSNGAADLFAAVCEHKYIHSLPMQHQANLKSNACIIRWMDDRLLIWRSGLLGQLLQQLLSPGFYSRMCLLKFTGRNQFIGLRIMVFQGQVCSFPWSTFCDELVDGLDGRAERLVSPLSFSNRKAQCKKLVGHMARVLDNSVGGITQLQAAIWLVLAELHRNGHPATRLRRLLWHVHTRMPFLELPFLPRKATITEATCLWLTLADVWCHACAAEVDLSE